MNAAEIVASALILGGAALALLAGVGLVCLPDVFARMHAATKPATLGLVLICLGAAVTDADLADIAKLLLVVVLQFLTAPVGAHMVGRAAYHVGGLLDQGTVLDELGAASDISGATEGRGGGADLDPTPDAGGAHGSGRDP